MGKIAYVAAAVVMMLGISSPGIVSSAQPGETLFKQHCIACHAEGGNIIAPQKTLHKKSMDANNIKTPQDIVRVMRQPGPGMPKFDEKTIPDKDARNIAEYILKTFK